MKFSQRIGKQPSVKIIQIESMDDELRIGLWNAYILFFTKIDGSRRYYSKSDLDEYFEYLWHEYFKLPADRRFDLHEKNWEYIRELFFKYQWFQVYDFLEFNARPEIFRYTKIFIQPFIDECNRILEREFSGYRIIDGKIAQISSNIEVDEINKTISIGRSFFHSKFENVNFHMQEALSKLSDKKNPDYRNSIKESISAVESLCREITGKNTLGDALKELEKKGIKLNLQLKSGIEKLYAYTNDKETGIRHSLMEGPNLPTFDEAKFFIVICSAFINFLISKMK